MRPGVDSNSSSDETSRSARLPALLDAGGERPLSLPALRHERGDAQPFQRREEGELRARVPHQPVADQAGGVEQPDERHPGDPREGTPAAEPAQPQLSYQMDDRYEYKGICRITVHAAQHAAEPPLELADRRVGARRARVEAQVKIEAAPRQHPEEQVAERSEICLLYTS